MNVFKLYGLDADGEVLFGEELRAGDADEARGAAEAALSRAHSVELWHEAVRIWSRRAPVG